MMAEKVLLSNEAKELERKNKKYGDKVVQLPTLSVPRSLVLHCKKIMK